MTQSAIRFKSRVAYVADEDLREFLKLLSFHLDDVLRKRNDLSWVVNITSGWMDDHESLPPGLRDIELDAALTSPDRVDAFIQLITGLLDASIGLGPYDKARARLVVERVVRELKSA